MKGINKKIKIKNKKRGGKNKKEPRYFPEHLEVDEIKLAEK